MHAKRYLPKLYLQEWYPLHNQDCRIEYIFLSLVLQVTIWNPVPTTNKWISLDWIFSGACYACILLEVERNTWVCWMRWKCLQAQFYRQSISLCRASIKDFSGIYNQWQEWAGCVILLWLTRFWKAFIRLEKSAPIGLLVLFHSDRKR